MKYTYEDVKRFKQAFSENGCVMVDGEVYTSFESMPAEIKSIKRVKSKPNDGSISEESEE